MLRLFIILLTFSSTLVFGSWQSNIGTDRPSNSAINVEVNANFGLLYGGAGTNVFGDLTAAGESVLYVNSQTTDNYTGALYNSTSKYMTTDAEFFSSVYTLGDARKRNSSSASLSLPAYVKGSHITWAGLFWQGYLHRDLGGGLTTAQVDNDVSGWNQVTLKTPDGIMHSLSAPIGFNNKDHKTYVYASKDDNSYRYYYGAYVDVTTLVQNSLDDGKTFTVGNIKTTEGQDFGDYMYLSHDLTGTNGRWYNGLRMGYYGGWSLVVVYGLDPESFAAHPEETLRNVAVYDGYDLFLIWSSNFTAPFETTIPITGFLTPKSGSIESKLLFFGGGADQGINFDTLQIRDGTTASFSNLTNATNPSGRQFNNTITEYGTNMMPLKPYHHGIDLDIFDVSGFMENDQFETEVKFGVVKSGNVCDQVFPQVLAFSTELYKPQFCYDYAYEQLDRTYTEENNGSQMPRIKAQFVSSSDPIEVSIYIRNNEDSDVEATNLVLDIDDIDVAQAKYHPDTVAITYPGNMWRTNLDDGDLDGSGDSYIHGMNIGAVSGQESFWTYFTLDPRTRNIDFPLDATFEYDMSLPLPDGSTFTFHTLSLLGHDMPLCSDSNFKYDAPPGIYNIAQQNLYVNHGLYDIPTQVARRVDDFVAVSYDKENLHVEKPVSTAVAVELIDAGKYHDFNASCFEPDSALTPRVWITFDDNVSRSDFTRETLQAAIAEGRVSDQIKGLGTTITSAEDFFKNARENTAFRISYNWMDDNGSILDLEPAYKHGTFVGWNVTNFTEAIKYNDGNCVSDVDGNPTNTDKIPQFCSNAGVAAASAMNAQELAICMECIYGYKTSFICSRDNFATRPEAFVVKINDQNQTNPASRIRIANDRTGTTTAPNLNAVNLAAGYAYHLDINATSHTDLEPVAGYVRGFGMENNEYNMTMVWDPEDSSINPNCNDTNDTPQTFNMIGGSTETNLTHPQVGEYDLEMIDRTWTRVDSDPAYMTHQTGIGFRSGPDCIENNSDVPDVRSVTPSTSGDNLTNVSGCNIESTHDQLNTRITPNVRYYYRDYNLTIHPYRLSTDNLIAPLGISQNDDMNGTTRYLYMNALKQQIDSNDSVIEIMALKFTGSIDAVGYDDELLSNFVSGCYAKDINFTNRTALLFAVDDDDADADNDVNLTNYIRYVNMNDKVIDSQEIDVNATIGQARFQKELNGSLRMEYLFNYERQTVTPANGTPPYMLAQNPVIRSFERADLQCVTTGECERNANFLLDDYNGTKNLENTRVNFLYARAYAPRYIVTGSSVDADLFYEFYCAECETDAALTAALQNTPQAVNSANGRGWYSNLEHDIARDGNITSGTLVERGGAGHVTCGDLFAYDDDGTETSTCGYDENQDYPYKTTVDYATSRWLLYNKYVPTSLLNNFPLEFYSTGGDWAGQREHDIATDTDSANITNRRIQW